MSNEQKSSIDVDYVANLARIEIKDDEKVAMKEKLEGILGYFEKISSLDVSGVEPIAHPFPSYNAWEDDEAIEPFSPEEALMNAPAKKDDQVVVPKVVE